MPGTIQVSVLDLMDLPSQADTHMLSLKVAMGKREYQTIGKGDFSFPVVSLRENLILMLYDEEGNVVSRTAEFKTMSVVEKGIWDDFFPLEGGGCVHMKLQFSLSEEERKRIREMRDSAMRRKHGEMLEGGLKISLSEVQNVGRTLIDQLQLAYPDERGNPSDTLSSEKSEGCSQDSCGQLTPHLKEVNKETIKIPPPPDGFQDRDISLEKCLDPHVGRAGPLVWRNDTGTVSFTSAEKMKDQMHGTKRENLPRRSSSSNIRKMISAFENNISQGLDPHVDSRTNPDVSKIHIGGSLESTSSKGSDMKKMMFPQTIAKSLSADMLSEFNFQQNPKNFGSFIVNKQEDIDHFGNGTWPEAVGKNNLFLERETDQNFKNMESCKQKAVEVKDDEGSSIDVGHITHSRSCNSTGTAPKPIETEEAVSAGGSAEDVSEREDTNHSEVGKSSFMFEKKMMLDAFPQEDCRLDAPVEIEISDAMPSSHNSVEPKILGTYDSPMDETNQSRHKVDNSIGTVGQIVSDYFQQSHDVDFKLLHKEDNKNGEHILPEEGQQSRKMLHESMNVDEPCSHCTYQHGSALDAVLENTDNRSHSNEQTGSGFSNETLDLSTYSEYEKCPFRSLGIWIPRYLCITSGSKKLKDLIDCSSSYVGINPVEKKTSSMEANEKPMMHDDLSTEVNKNAKISYISEKSNLENSVGTPKLNGGLVEQGVRVIIIMVACGTLLLNTRQRKPREDTVKERKGSG